MTVKKIIVSFLVCSMIPSPAWAFSLPLPRLHLPPVLPGADRNIEIVGSTVTVHGLTDQANKVFVNGREAAIQKDGSFVRETIIPLGDTEIVVEVKDPNGKSSRHSKTIKADKNHYFLVGIADGTLDFARASAGFDFQHDNASVRKGTHPNGKISYYFAGKVLGKYLIKSALDTDKATQEKLFTNIDPDKYYPIYGDNSTVVYDVHSQGKFYLKLEWDESGLVVGNFQTNINENEERLATYNRTLSGAKVHLETSGRTIYGDPKTKATAFIADANQLSGHSEFLATGGSLYYLRHRNIVEGSEQVRIEVRDKNSHMVLSSASQRENADYEIKYDEGRILFKRPVSSLSHSDTVITDSVQEGNEVFVVVNYEYREQDAFTASTDLNNLSGGLHVSQNIGNYLRVGGTHVQEEHSDNPHRLTGVDGTLRLGNFTKVDMEYAETRADTTNAYISYNGGYNYTELTQGNGAHGAALRTSFNTSLGEYFGKGKEWADVSGYVQTIDAHFSPVDSFFQAGTTKSGAEVSHRISKDDRVRLLYEDSLIDDGVSLNTSARNDLKAMRIRNGTTQWLHDWEKFTFTSEYRIQGKEDSLNSVGPIGEGESGTHHDVAERMDYRLSSATDLFISQQIGINKIRDDSLSTAGFSHRLTPNLTLHLQGSGWSGRNAVLAGVEQRVNENTSRYVSYSVNHSAMDGKSYGTTFGSNTKISDTAELRRENQWVTSDLRGTYKSELSSLQRQMTPHWAVEGTYERRDETLNKALRGATPRDAVSGITAYNLPDHLKAFAKMEFRRDTEGEWQVVSDNQAEWKMTRDFHLFGEYEYSRGDDEIRHLNISRIEKRQAGIAFRPVNYDWLNGLFKFTHFQDDRPHDLTSPNGGFVKQNSKYYEFAGEFAVDLPWHFQVVEKAAIRKEEFTAVDVNNIIETPAEQKAYLLVHRLNYHLTNRFDVAAEFRLLRQRGSDTENLQYGPLAEFTYQIQKNIGVGVGYNFTSFKDDLTVLHQRAQGLFVRLQGKY